MPRFIVIICILYNICKVRGEAFVDTRMTLDNPISGKAFDTLNDAWAEAAFLAKHHRQTHHQAFLIREVLEDYFLGQYSAGQEGVQGEDL